MKYHQFRLIPTHYESALADVYRAKIPKFMQFVDEPYQRFYPDGGRIGEMFFHEMAHCMELVQRGQIHRLAIQNFGWPKDKVGYFNAASAEAECRVVALAILLELHLTGNVDSGSTINNADTFALFIESPQTWNGKANDMQNWRFGRGAKVRINENMNEYRGSVGRLLQATVDYIVDHCAEHV